MYGRRNTLRAILVCGMAVSSTAFSQVCYSEPVADAQTRLVSDIREAVERAEAELDSMAVRYIEVVFDRATDKIQSVNRFDAWLQRPAARIRRWKALAHAAARTAEIKETLGRSDSSFFLPPTEPAAKFVVSDGQRALSIYKESSATPDWYTGSLGVDAEEPNLRPAFLEATGFIASRWLSTYFREAEEVSAVETGAEALAWASKRRGDALVCCEVRCKRTSEGIGVVAVAVFRTDPAVLARVRSAGKSLASETSWLVSGEVIERGRPGWPRGLPLALVRHSDAKATPHDTLIIVEDYRQEASADPDDYNVRRLPKELRGLGVRAHVFDTAAQRTLLYSDSGEPSMVPPVGDSTPRSSGEVERTSPSGVRLAVLVGALAILAIGAVAWRVRTRRRGGG